MLCPALAKIWQPEKLPVQVDRQLVPQNWPVCHHYSRVSSNMLWLLMCGMY